MAKIGRPATGQGNMKYIPLAALSVMGLLVFLAKQGDKQTLNELEEIAKKKAMELGYIPSESEAATHNQTV